MQGRVGLGRAKSWCEFSKQKKNIRKEQNTDTRKYRLQGKAKITPKKETSPGPHRESYPEV